MQSTHSSVCRIRSFTSAVFMNTTISEISKQNQTYQTVTQERSSSKKEEKTTLMKSLRASDNKSSCSPQKYSACRIRLSSPYALFSKTHIKTTNFSQGFMSVVPFDTKYEMGDGKPTNYISASVISSKHFNKQLKKRETYADSFRNRDTQIRFFNEMAVDLLSC